jgi:hypothetical protein
MHPLHERRTSAQGLPWAAVALAVSLAFLPGIARAQSAPSPAPSTAPVGTGGGNPQVTNPTGAAAAAPPAAPVSHLPIIDIVPTQTYPLYYHTQQQLKDFEPFDVGGTIRVPVTRWFSVQFDRLVGGTLDQPFTFGAATGANPNAGAANNTRDVVLLYHGTFTFNKYLALDIGDGFRHRIWASGASTKPENDPLTTNPNAQASGVSNAPYPLSYSSTEAHYGYAGLTYSLHPIRELHNTVFTFGEQVEAQNVDHHVGEDCSAEDIADNIYACAGLLPGQSGVKDENPNQNRYYTTTQSVAATIPLDPRKHGSTLSINETWGYLNWYENANFPYRWSSAITYLLQKKFNDVFTLGVRVRDYHQDPQGAPEPFPGTIHVGSIDLLGTFHIDTNTIH